MMQMVDWLACGLILLVAVMGYFRGFFSQAMSLLALVLSIVASAYIAGPLSSYLAEQELTSSIHTYYLTRFVVAVVLYAMAKVFIWYFDQRLHKKEGKRAGINRLAGFLLGGCKGVVVVGALLLLLNYITPALLERYTPWLAKSYLLSLMRQHNPISHTVLLANLQTALQLLSTPEGSRKLEHFLQERGIKAKERLGELKSNRLAPWLEDASLRKLLSTDHVFEALNPAPPML